MVHAPHTALCFAPCHSFAAGRQSDLCLNWERTGEAHEATLIALDHRTARWSAESTCYTACSECGAHCHPSRQRVRSGAMDLKGSIAQLERLLKHVRYPSAIDDVG